MSLGRKSRRCDVGSWTFESLPRRMIVWLLMFFLVTVQEEQYMKNTTRVVLMVVELPARNYLSIISTLL